MPCSRPAISRDGKQIVTASRDRTASLWDAASGKPLRRFQEGHEFLVSGAVFFPDGKHLATGAGDNSVRIWDLTAGTQSAVLTPTGRIGTLAVSPDGKWLATGSPGTDIKLWNAHNRRRRSARSPATRPKFPRSRSRPTATGSPAATIAATCGCGD